VKSGVRIGIEVVKKKRRSMSGGEAEKLGERMRREVDEGDLSEVSDFGSVLFFLEERD